MPSSKPASTHPNTITLMVMGLTLEFCALLRLGLSCPWLRPLTRRSKRSEATQQFDGYGAGTTV